MTQALGLVFAIYLAGMLARRFLPVLVLAACGTPAPEETAEPAPGAGPVPGSSYAADTAFLRRHDPELVTLSRGRASLVASAKYQGIVFTSTATGAESFGYIAEDVFEAEAPDPHINGYGGENRLWLGPEGGQYSIFFEPGVVYDRATWYTPPAIDVEPWTLARADDRTAVFAKTDTLVSRAGTEFRYRIDRTVTLLDDDAVAERFAGVPGFGESPTDVSAVAYRTDNALTNAGPSAWTREGGTLCLWALDMLPGSDSVVVVYPLSRKPTGADTVVKYFGEMGPDQLRLTDEYALLRGSGSALAKIGLPPGLATGTGAAIDYARGTLTVFDYDVDPGGTYLGMEWRDMPDPYAGDAVTTYNDPGPDAFYELESIGEAAFLAPGEQTEHRHTVYHFTGPVSALEEILTAVTGVAAGEVRAFK